MESEKQATPQASSTRRIAKNTLMLYFRQILIMLVSLYTVRVVLATLGAEDYGVYNVVAGVVVFFTFFNDALSTATQRFLNFELSKNDSEKVKTVFAVSFLIHIALAVLISVLVLTIGLWFLNHKMNIPEGRIDAAKVVLYCSAVTTVFNVIRIPFNATIIAYERMGFFAALSLVECFLKLAVAFVLKYTDFDRLVFYSVLLTLSTAIVFFCYVLFCNLKIKIFKIGFDKKIANEILKFSGWSLLGGFANVCNSHGINILVNMFCGVVANAAMGIANQVNTAVCQFIYNFQTAFSPQIIKSYAGNERGYFNSLISTTAKVSVYLLALIALPLYCNAEFVLTLWLKNVPQYTLEFVHLMIIWSLIESINGPFVIAVRATGNIRVYQIIVSVLIFLNLPLSFVFLKLGFSPVVILYIRIAEHLVASVWRIAYVSKLVGFDVDKFVKKTVLPMLPILSLSFFVCEFVRRIIQINFLSFLLSSVCFAGVLFLLAWFFALNITEKLLAKNYLKKLERRNK